MKEEFNNPSTTEPLSISSPGIVLILIAAFIAGIIAYCYRENIKKFFTNIMKFFMKIGSK
jgi:hypothetical protein